MQVLKGWQFLLVEMEIEDECTSFFSGRKKRGEDKGGGGLIREMRSRLEVVEGKKDVEIKIMTR